VSFFFAKSEDWNLSSVCIKLRKGNVAPDHSSAGPDFGHSSALVGQRVEMEANAGSAALHLLAILGPRTRVRPERAGQDSEGDASEARRTV